MEITRKRKLCYPKDQLIELIRRHFNGTLEAKEKLGRFRKPVGLHAANFDKDPQGPQLYQVISSDDVNEVLDRMEYTAVFYMGKTLWGFLVLSLQILIGDKEADKGDLVLYPSPNDSHYELAIRVFDLYLEEHANKVDLQTPKDLDEIMLLAPKDKNYARRIMEADLSLCQGRI